MKILSTIFLFFFIAYQVNAQKTVTISGKVLENESGEVLIGASVQVKALKKGVVTNQYDFFSLSLPEGVYELSVSYAGFNTATITQTCYESIIKTIYLEPITLAEVVVKDQNRMDQEVGFTNIPVSRLKEIPTLLGEPDLFKALAFTPGITNGQEGNSGLYVRGGSPEQNLILLDEAPVYNTSHVFGFVSIFNADAIKNIDVYKGGFPARFGGRLASVVDISMKDGNKSESKKEFSIGLLSTRFLIEGPLAKGTTSYMVAGRSMNTAFFLLPQLISGKSDRENALWFYDLNVKLHHIFNDKSQLYFSFYNSNDYWKTQDNIGQRKSATTLGWGNFTSTLRYNRIISPKLFGKASLIFSKFDYQFGNSTENVIQNETVTNAYNVQNTVRDWAVKMGVEYIPSSNYTLRAGIEHFWHRFHPGRVSVTSSNSPEVVKSNQSPPIYAQESALYLENDFTYKIFRFNAGLRYSSLQINETNYGLIEPRLGINTHLSEQLIFKLGVSQMQQYLHQLTSNGVGLPNDIWVTATEKIAPMQAQQIDGGFYLDLGGKSNWQLSLEGYYKKMSHLIDYPQGSDILTNLETNWQDLVVKDVEGKAYGLEVMLQKKIGKFNGWVSYTRSISERRSDQINLGAWYPSRYQREHNIAITANYQFAKKWFLSTNWVYQTGYPVTLPEGAMVGIDGRPRLIYAGRNNFRMPDYHRLDIGLTTRFQTKRGKEVAWSFGVYNAYNQENPYYLEPTINYRYVTLPNNTQTAIFDNIKITQHSAIPILPYFSYAIKF